MSVGRLVSIGNVLIDLTLRVAALPERGGDVLARDDGATVGGAYNTLVAARRLGLGCAYAGGHGTGPFGDRARQALASEGIEVLLERSPEADTGYDLALIDDEGEHTFVTVFGAEARLSQADITGIRLRAGDLVHVSGYGLLERSNAGVLAPWIAGIEAGHPVLVDPGPLASDIPSPVLSRVAGRADWLSCNLREARALSGRTEAGAAAAWLRTRWRAVIIRLGPEGCLLATDGIELVPGFPVEAIDTTGAGDAHTGAFLAGLAAGEPPRVAARRANACAALAVTRRGPATAPTRAQVDRLLASGSMAG